MVRALVLLGVLALGACSSSTAAEGNAWYQIGDASYDAVRRADDACQAHGGHFQLKPGGDPTHMGDYECGKSKGTS